MGTLGGKGLKGDNNCQLENAQRLLLIYDISSFMIFFF